MKSKPTIIVVGAGNVAWHLCKAFQASNLNLIGVANRTIENLTSFKNAFSIEVLDLNHLPESDIAIIAISDSAIGSTSEMFKNSNATIIHTSGTCGINELHEKIENKGVFYPFQTFTSGKSIEYKSIPTFIEFDSKKTLEHLNYLSSAFGSKNIEIDSESKKSLHISGVIANNFINKLLQEAIEILENNEIPKEVIWPLVEETIDKAKILSPQYAQTGPAIRGDEKTIEEHLQFLKSQPELRNVYSILSNLIQR